MFVFHLTVPAGVSHLDIHTDFLATAAATTGFSSGASVSANLAVLSWNSVLLYPDNVSATDLMIKPAINLPESWQVGTALEGTDSMHSVWHIPGALQTRLPRTPHRLPRPRRSLVPRNPPRLKITPKHFLDLAGDGPEDLASRSEHIDAVLQPRPRDRCALQVAPLRQSITSSSRFPIRSRTSASSTTSPPTTASPHNTFTDDSAFILNGLLLPHEFTHSWNGKYRRPAGLATRDYQKPMVGDLLWVYEGLTEYLGDVLAARCGIWSPGVYRDRLANVAAYLNDRPPRPHLAQPAGHRHRGPDALPQAGGAYDNYPPQRRLLRRRRTPLA